MCEFCDAELLRQKALELGATYTRPTPPIAVTPSPPTRAMRPILPIIMLAITFAIVGIGVAAATLFSSESTLPEAERPSSPTPQVAPVPTLEKPLRELQTHELILGATVKAASLPEGEFDVVDALPWSKDLAKEWRSDAVLTRVTVEQVSREGLLQLQRGSTNEITYEFKSAACTLTQCWLRLQVRDDGTVFVRTVTSGSSPLDEPFCAPRKMVPHILKNKIVPARQAYRLDLSMDGRVAKWTVYPKSGTNDFKPIYVRGACTSL